ncbi:ABC transporter permease [Paenibacillus sp. SN-8-1]|uniref:ABC transporter permease n=1 Tax=Paenibacillus sp. SN-8-1 TaxID=3435409 RepID=UPI003D9A99D7
MNLWIRFMILDIRLLARSKVFYYKLILLPIALIFILGTIFGPSSSSPSSNSGESTYHADLGMDNGLDIPIKWVASEKQSVSPMQYEAAAMTVLFSFLTSFELAHSLVRDKLNNTMNRIRSAPTAIRQYVIGKLLGITLAIVVQMIIVILCSWLVFRVNWGSISEALGVTFIYGLSIGSLVLCCGFWAKDHAAISSLTSPVLYGLGFLGGSFFNTAGFPLVLKKIQEWTPNGKAINAYLHIFQGGSLSSFVWDMLSLTVVAVLFFVLALRSASKRKEG